MDTLKMDPEKMREYAERSARGRIEVAHSVANSPAIQAFLDKYVHLSGRLDGFKPFADETSSQEVGGLTIENHLDRVVAYDGHGVDVEITRDQSGLAMARSWSQSLVREARETPTSDVIPPVKVALAGLMNDVLTSLESDPDLPAKIEVVATTSVPNPFA